MALAATSLAVERGWSPLIVLAGAGDPDRATTRLRAVSHLWRTLLDHTEMDAATHAFIRRASAALGDFNLAKLYELLPEQSGAFHQLSVIGVAAPTRYWIGRPGSEPPGLRGSRGAGAAQQLGDASLLVRAAPVEAKGGDLNYLMQVRAGVVVGPTDWATVVEAAESLLRLLAEPAGEPSARPMVALRASVLSRNPKLSAEDVEPLATLWEAFPRMGQLLSGLVTCQDLIVPGAGAQHMLLKLRLDADRMRERYPELAGYLSGLHRLAEADLRWVDMHGRTLATLHIDSGTLSARLELFATDGRIVPSSKGVPLMAEALDNNPGAYPYRLLASANLRMLGVRTHVRSVRLDFVHERSERGMNVRANMTHVPEVKVLGAALGFIPTGLIDAIIPGDMQGLFDKALSAACYGNHGNGVELKLQYEREPEQPARMGGAVALEAIDNFLVKLGVGFFNDRLMPDDAVREDTRRLLRDVHAAYAADVERYARARD